LSAGSQEQQKLLDVMDQTCLDLSDLVGRPGEIQYLYNSPTGTWWDTKKPDLPKVRTTVRDALGTTHHESGTLWMGSAPDRSVTDQWGCFWETENLFAIGPAVLPRMGSPNPMLSGVALTRRTGDHVLRRNVIPAEDGFEPLFDGSDTTFGRWLMA
jgi:GMC oxidoreductase